MIRAVAVLLLLWEPLNFAVEALTVLPTVRYRGVLPVVELSAHALVAALAASAGLALLNRTPAARTLALAAISASLVRTLQSVHASSLPRQMAPGQEWFVTALVAAVALIAVVVVVLERGRAG